MIKWIIKKINKIPTYSYGFIVEPCGRIRNAARKNNITGDVEFVLWKAGEQGHKEDYWHKMGDGWSKLFVSSDGDNNA